MNVREKRGRPVRESDTWLNPEEGTSGGNEKRAFQARPEALSWKPAE